MYRVKKQNSGLTLIELMVVIAIIGILTVIGLTIYSGAMKKARDAKRITEINAIASAMEMNFNGLTNRYAPIQKNWFASGEIPKDPMNWQLGCGKSGVIPPLGGGYSADEFNQCVYCVNTRHGVGYCGGSNEIGINAAGEHNPGDYSNDDRCFIICANLENGSFYCEGGRRRADCPPPDRWL